jgi:predicted RNase H-like HicB family nuclease
MTTTLYTFQIVIEKEADGDGYTAYSPTLAGCFRRATTLEDAKQKIREAVRERVESLLARREQISQCDRLMHVEELSIAIAGRCHDDSTHRRRTQRKENPS